MSTDYSPRKIEPKRRRRGVKEPDWFVVGIAVAAAHVASRGEMVIAQEILKHINGVTLAELVKAGVDEFELKLLRPLVIVQKKSRPQGRVRKRPSAVQE